MSSAVKIAPAEIVQELLRLSLIKDALGYFIDKADNITKQHIDCTKLLVVQQKPSPAEPRAFNEKRPNVSEI